MHRDTQGGQGGTPDAPTQLVELSEPELLGVEDHHEGCLRDVDADLNDGRCDEERGASGGKVLHDLGFHGCGCAPRELMDGHSRERRVGSEVGGNLADGCQWARVLLVGIAHLVGGVDTRADNVDAPPLRDLLGGSRPCALHPRGVCCVREVGGHGRTAAGHAAHAGFVQVPEHGHGDCAWDRRRSHHQFMDAVPILAGSTERGTLLDAEAVLLVDDDESEVGKTHRFLEESVRADDDERLRRIHGRLDLSAGSRRR